MTSLSLRCNNKTFGEDILLRKIVVVVFIAVLQSLICPVLLHHGTDKQLCRVLEIFISRSAVLQLPVVVHNILTGDYYWKTCLEGCLKESGITQVTIGKETKHDNGESLIKETDVVR